MGIEFTSILKNIIVEESREEFLLKKYTQGKNIDGVTYPPTIDTNTFYGIIGFDPTTITDQTGNVSRVGSYSQWLLNYYVDVIPNSCIDLGYEFGSRSFDECTSVNRELFLEDLYKVKDDLTKFDRFKNQIDPNFRDINKIKSVDQLYGLVKDFKLIKKGTKEEKEAAKKTYEYPGSEIVYKGSNWTVIKISDAGQLGKNAACFFGGYHEPDMGESRWCTSSPGLSYFEKYIKDGPLYVILPNQTTKFGQKTGLPVERYQFHFESNQFMDRHDHDMIDLVEFLTSNSELKDFFKSIFLVSLNKKLDLGAERLTIKYPDSNEGKFIKLYGFDEFIDLLPNTLRLFMLYGSGDSEPVSITEKFCKFKNLQLLGLSNSVNSIPDCITELNDLKFLSLNGNMNLTSLPKDIGNMKRLEAINLTDTGIDEVDLPDSLKNNKGNITVLPFWHKEP